MRLVKDTGLSVAFEYFKGGKMKDLAPDSDSENSLGIYITPAGGMVTDTNSSEDLCDSFIAKREPELHLENQ
ncbi:hypothetical protein CEXT_216221 [Caerostris extrusa]|uniref:Uncharacterized protein n=1 Tax=Caerostris extrusa TaxID=172846 RepID=A0AAV4U953_CAEEX|nr:hypothetical protein CEXT_216221 [Caerostris extrusa]